MGPISVAHSGGPNKTRFIIEHSMFQKGRAWGRNESRVRGPKGTVHYIVNKVFSCQNNKKLKRHGIER